MKATDMGRLIAVGTLIAVASSCLFAARCGRRREPTNELVRAANQMARRPSDARLAGSFDYKPFEIIRGTKEDHADAAPLRIATAKMLEAGRGDRTIEMQHARGVASFLDNRPDEALSAFEEQLRVTTREEQASRGIQKSNDAVLLTDLAAAYSTRVLARHQTYAVLSAIAAAERAAQLDRQSPAAAWNRAVALEQLGDREDARAAWDAYLLLDSNSGWATEARRRKIFLEAQRDQDLWPGAARRLRIAAEHGDANTTYAIVRRFPTRALTMLERQVLPAWARAVEEERLHDAATELHVASVVAAAIADTTGDRLYAEVTRTADTTLAHAFVAWAQTPVLLKRGERAAAIEEMRRIRHEVERRRSPASIRFTLALAYRLYEGRDHQQAIAELDHIQSSLRAYPISEALYHWRRGLAEISLGYAAQAMKSYGESIRIFDRINDPGSAGSVELMRADAAEYAGDTDQAWQSYGRAMRDIDLHGDPTMLDLVLFAVARSALRRAYPAAALILQNRWVASYRGKDRDGLLCQALIARSETYASVDHGADARADCEKARRIFQTISDPAIQNHLQADLDLSTAAAYASQTRSVAPLSSALDTALKNKDHFRIAQLYLLRANAYERLGDPGSTEADLRNGLDEIEEQRSKLSSEEFRITWLDTWRGMNERLVWLLIRKGRFDDAFEAAEQARARVTLEHIANARPATVAAVRQRLPSGAAFITLWLSSDDDVVAWIVRRDRTVCRQFPMRGAARRIHTCLRGFEPGNEPATADAAPESLARDLVRPWIADVSDVRLLVLSPDGALSLAPFAALIENHVLALEPSAAIFIATPSPVTRWSSALFVDNPATSDPVSNPPLVTTAEMRELTAGAFRVALLRREEATPAQFLALAPATGIVHFAGHAVDGAYGEGALLFAPDRQHPDGRLSARDIERGPIRNGGMVVLAACRTSSGRIGSEGALSLSRSFLVAGSGAVVGSLWNVDDEATDQLFAAFYRHLAAGTSAVESLHAAQRELSARYRQPRYWAAFHMYGGV